MNDRSDASDTAWTLMMGLLSGRLLISSIFLIILSFALACNGIAFYAFIALSYTVTIPYSLWMRNQNSMRRMAPLQFLIDLVFVSGLVYFSGSRGHDFLILLYPLIILSAGIILPLKQTIQITILSILAYALVALLMSQQLLPDSPPAVSTFPSNLSIQDILLRITVFIAFGAASAYVSHRCDHITRKEKKLHETTHHIFKHVKTGLLLLDSNNDIIMANDRACALLGHPPGQQIKTNLSAIHLTPSDIEPTDRIERGASDYFRRTDGSIFPVSIEDALLTLPAEAFPNTPSETVIRTRVINFTDLSHFLHLQNQTRQLERINAAANMAKEMAHQIRTPLTVISGAAQMVLQTKNDAENHSQEREQLCDQIVIESKQLNQVIQNFIDYAEFSPQDARDLLQMEL